MTYPKRVLIAIDQLFAVVLFGCMPDETISAMANRRGWKRLERLINWLFRDDMHCAQAYIAEMAGSQNASIYRKE
jgi:hypothetical protein